MLLVTLIFFLFGLIIGSFLNVVLFRTESDLGLGGRSHCRSCGALIHWYDNIPLLSFLLLYGRCRQCRAKIDWQYPVVECATGLLFACAGFFVFRTDIQLTWMPTLWWCFLFSVLLIITVYDLRHMEIPVNFLLWGIGGTFGYLLLSTWFFWEGGSFLTSPLILGLLGGLLAASFFYLLVWMSHERWMGMGDVWLAFLSGMTVGPQLALTLLTLSFTLGALGALILMVFQKKKLSAQVPFAPSLAVATVILLLFLAKPPSWFFLFLFPLT